MRRQVTAEHWIDKADLRKLSQGCEDCNLSGRLLSSYKIAFQGAIRVHCPANRVTKSNANLLCYVTNMLSDTIQLLLPARFLRFDPRLKPRLPIMQIHPG